MASNNNSNVFFDRILPTAYSVGAAVVVLGALFKIQHYPGGGEMLTIGLGVEAVIFLLYALQTYVQQSNEPDWTRVYPELADDYTGPRVNRNMQANGLTANMDKMMSEANITPDIFQNLGKGLKNLNESVGQMNTFADATVATDKYAQNVKTASESINEMNKSYSVAIEAMTSMADATKDAQEYRDQFQVITKNMGALNAVYELELQDTNKHLKAMNAFYSNLTSAMDNMSDATKESQAFKNHLSTLNENIDSLNTIYGNMLSAMKGK